MLNELSTRLMHVHQGKAFLYAKEAQKEASALNNDTEKAKADYLLAVNLGNTGAYDQAINILSEALNYYKDVDEGKNIETASIYLELGKMYLEINNSEKALKYIKRAEQLFELLNNKKGLANCYLTMAKLQLNVNNLKQAKINTEWAEEIINSIKEPSVNISIRLAKGDIFYFEEKYNEAIELYREALMLSIDEQNKFYAVECYTKLGASFSKIDNKQAEDYYSKAIDMAREIGSQRMMAEVLFQQGVFLLEKKKRNEAIGHFVRSLTISSQIGNKYLEAQNHLYLFKNYNQINAYEQALNHYRLHVSLLDSMRSMESQRQLSELEVQYETDKKQKEIDFLERENQYKEERQFYFFLGLILAGLLIGILLLSWIMKRRANLVLEKQAIKIEEQNKQLGNKNNLLKKQHTLIKDSITYAQRIQAAVLPKREELRSCFKHHVLFYKPKDIVSGDFYWLHEDDTHYYLAVADCTGHGVPGGFMSIVAHGMLEKIVKQDGYKDVNQILEQLNEEVINTIQKSAVENVKDSLDIAFCKIDKEMSELTYAGACMPLYHVRDGVLKEITADRIHIGKNKLSPNESFQKHTINLEKGDMIYLFSDGFPDQKGGEKRKKYYYGPFRDLLAKLSEFKDFEQESMLYEELLSWKKGVEQIDDILILGVRITSANKENKDSRSSTYNVSSFYNKGLKDISDQLINSYCGKLTQEILNEQLSAVKSKIDTDSSMALPFKRTYKILVEALENMLKHSINNGYKDQEIYYILYKNDSFYEIQTGNIVNTKEKLILEQKYSEIEGKDAATMKDMYREKIKTTSISSRGGAGLGFIDMAMKSENNVAIYFEHLDNNNYLYNLHVKVYHSQH